MQFQSRDVIEIDLRSVIFKNVSCHGSTSEYEMKDVLRFLVMVIGILVSQNLFTFSWDLIEKWLCTHSVGDIIVKKEGNIAHFSVNLFCSRQK